VTEHGDLDVFLVRRRAEPEEVKEPADEQEGDRTTHAGDLARSAESLLRPRILSVRLSGSWRSYASCRSRSDETLWIGTAFKVIAIPPRFGPRWKDGVDHGVGHLGDRNRGLNGYVSALAC
jgi:hypothetical protein